MFKSLTARAIVPVAVAVTGFVIICCILLYSLMKSDIISDTVTYATGLADTVVKSTRYAMLNSDRETLKNIIDNVGEQKRLEHVRIFNKKGLIMFSSVHGEINRFVDKKAAGCVECHSGPVPKETLAAMQKARRFTNERGVEVLAITAPIYNEPECSAAPCHIHPAEQKVLGTLDIGLSLADLLQNLKVMRERMIVFSIMVLLLTVGGVAALLWRNVFLPLRLLIEYTERTAQGDLTAELPDCGPELSKLANNVRTLSEELKQAESSAPRGEGTE
ncbi:MAG: HAMP domain-containing protein [Geobacter sp.]|nr:HAMP domain-containing protein [Geobacter sp.]